MIKKGRLIIFEGPDGVGKTTLSDLTAEQLRISGEEVIQFSFPGNDQGTVGHLVYHLHHDKKFYKNASKAAIQALHIAAHIDAIENRIIPAYTQGKTVVMDRYWWSTYVYGVADAVDKDLLDSLIQAERIAWDDIVPDIVFLVDRNEPLRKEPKKRWSKWRKTYFELQSNENKIYPATIQRNVGTIEDSITSIMNKIDALQLVNRDNVRVNIHTKSKRPTPTVVFDTYWKFATERQRVYFKRLNGSPFPWTKDKILVEHKFTNAYRACDRVSQYLIKNVIYTGPQDINEIFFRTILFKLFNKIETWEYLSHSLEEICYKDYSYEKYDQLLTDAIDANERIYSAAYIMPSGKSTFGFDKKHRNNLRLLERMLADDLPSRLADSDTMKQGFDLLVSYPTLGPFLAYQFITDINYSTTTGYSEMEFVVPGPGAIDGLSKCFSDYGDYSKEDVIRLVCEEQDLHFKRLSLDFQSLWGRPLQLIDCQNLFCEISKYSRVAHPEFKGKAGRTRIKQKYSWTGPLGKPFFPPKWDINESIMSP